ncbi:hypothetical protein D3C77_622740 [compost metagenome]
MMSLDSYIQRVPAASSMRRHGTFTLPPPACSCARASGSPLASRSAMGALSLWMARRVLTQNGQAWNW